MTPEERTECASVLRAAADLVEAGEATGKLQADLTFWVQHTPDQPAAVRAVAQAIPLRWSGVASTTSGGVEWYDLTASTEGASSIHGIKVRIYASAEAVGRAVGTRTITEWEPNPEIAALLGQDPEERP